MVLHPGNLSIVIDVVLFGDAVQAIDPGIPASQSFLQFGHWTHVLVTRPMKFYAGLAQPLLNVESIPASTSPLPLRVSSPYHNSVSSGWDRPRIPNLGLTSRSRSVWRSWLFSPLDELWETLLCRRRRCTWDRRQGTLSIFWRLRTRRPF